MPGLGPGPRLKLDHSLYLRCRFILSLWGTKKERERERETERERGKRRERERERGGKRI